jgi:hypothetical protein
MCRARVKNALGDFQAHWAVATRYNRHYPKSRKNDRLEESEFIREQPKQGRLTPKDG